MASDLPPLGSTTCQAKSRLGTRTRHRLRARRRSGLPPADPYRALAGPWREQSGSTDTALVAGRAAFPALRPRSGANLHEAKNLRRMPFLLTCPAGDKPPIGARRRRLRSPMSAVVAEQAVGQDALVARRGSRDSRFLPARCDVPRGLSAARAAATGCRGYAAESRGGLDRQDRLDRVPCAEGSRAWRG